MTLFPFLKLFWLVGKTVPAHRFYLYLLTTSGEDRYTARLLQLAGGRTRVVPIEDIRAKEGNLSIPLHVGGETQVQTDAAAEHVTTALAGGLESSRKVRDSLQTFLNASSR